MNLSKRNKIIAKARARRDETMQVKGAEYSDSQGDINSNFKLGGQFLQLALRKAGHDVSTETCSELCWFVYYFKHLCSLINFIGTQDGGCEGIKSRLDDMANYTEIFYSLIQESSAEVSGQAVVDRVHALQNKMWYGDKGPYRSIADMSDEELDDLTSRNGMASQPAGLINGIDEQDPFIETHTGNLVHLGPQHVGNTSEISLVDIAYSLSRLCRYTGHCDVEFPPPAAPSFIYTVAQHSFVCSMYAKAAGRDERMQLLCLLHDAAEAYTGDLNRPLRHLLPGIKKIEAALMTRIYNFMGVTPPTIGEEETIKQIDNAACRAEAFLMLPSKGEWWGLGSVDHTMLVTIKESTGLGGNWKAHFDTRLAQLWLPRVTNVPKGF